MNKKLYKYIPYILVIFALVLIVSPKYFSKADPESAEATISATLYDSSAYSSGTVLTETGATVSGWEVDTNKYLQIDPEVPNDGNTYKVIIELPQEFYAAIQEITTPSGYSDVSFTKNSHISINTNKTYNLKTYSGTFEYTMEAKQTKGTIQLAISYDEILWGNFANAKLTPDGVKPITVKLRRGTETIKEISIGQATSGAKRGFGSSIYLNGNATTCSVRPTEKVAIRPLYSASNQSTYFYYYPKLTMKIKLPAYKDSNGNVLHYIDMDTTNFTFNSITTGTAEYTVNDSDIKNGNITITFKDIYMRTGTLFTFNVKFPSAMTAEPSSTYLFNGGKVEYTAESKNGVSTNRFYNLDILSITFTTVTEENVSINKYNAYATINNRPTEAVGRFGGFGLTNTGKGDSGQKNIKFEFDTGNTNLTKVTTINVPADKKQQYISIKYKLVDEDGNLIYFDSNGNVVSSSTEGAQDYWIYNQSNSHYNKTTKTNLNNRLLRNNLIEGHRSYYFKSIEFSLQTIEAGMKLYANSSTSSVTSTGNFFGYINENATSGEIANHKITVTSDDNTSITQNCTTTTTMTNNPAFYISAQSLSETSIEAGDSLDLSATVTIVDYPYGYSTWLKNIVIGIAIPEGITINERTLNIKDSAGTKITGYTFLPPQDAGDGNNIWKIKLPDNVSIGKYSESLGNMPTGASISFSMTLETALSMNTTLLELKNMIYVSGINQTNSSGGSFNYAKKVDKYDINENNIKTDYVTGVRENNTITCQITPKVATLDLADSISIQSKGNILNSEDNNLYTPNDMLTYNVNIGCSSGGQVNDFQYYIPIPKSVTINDDFILSKNDFEFCMQSSATMTGDDIFNIFYTFETGLEYETAKSVTNWYTEDEIQNDSNLDWKDVTMIKLTMKNGVIDNGDSSIISVVMKYNGNAFNEEAGMIDSWSSGGEYNYLNNGRVVSGNIATNGVEVMLNCEINLSAITLTAAKDRVPQGAGNVNSVTVNSELPIFVNKQNFTISNIETNNVILQTKGYMQSNLDMSSVLANQTFGITVQLNSGSELDLVKNTDIGENSANTSPIFKYEIYNANSLSDNLQTRYVVVTYKSNNGVTIKQRINVNREVTAATEAQPAIVAGKYFTTISDTETTVTITQNSSISAQFSNEYIPTLYKNQKIVFSDVLPVGTRLIMINKRGTNAQTYWYHSITTTGQKEISLENFYQMGTTATNYTRNQETNSVNEQFIIIADFEKCTTYLENKEHTINLVYEGDSALDYESTTLKFTTTAKRNFEITSVTTNAIVDTDFNINCTIGDVSGVETKYLGKKLALVLSAPSNMPSDAYITDGTTEYYMNSERKYIIPLNEIQNETKSITAKVCSKMWPKTATTYILNVELWISDTSDGENPFWGECMDAKTINLNTVVKPEPALKVQSMTKRIVKDLSVENNITFNYKKINGCKVTLELQRKVGNGYQKMTNVLSEVNGVTKHTQGVFDLNPTNGINTIPISLSVVAERGTYRLVFKVTDSSSNMLIEIPYNFMIIK